VLLEAGKLVLSDEPIEIARQLRELAEKQFVRVDGLLLDRARLVGAASLLVRFTA
jgi:hypothetical protein